jgi:hypothetical protein
MRVSSWFDPSGPIDRLERPARLGLAQLVRRNDHFSDFRSLDRIHGRSRRDRIYWLIFDRGRSTRTSLERAPRPARSRAERDGRGATACKCLRQQPDRSSRSSPANADVRRCRNLHYAGGERRFTRRGKKVREVEAGFLVTGRKQRR